LKRESEDKKYKLVKGAKLFFGSNLGGVEQ